MVVTWSATDTGEYHPVVPINRRRITGAAAGRRFGDADPDGWAIVDRYQHGSDDTARREAFAEFYARYYPEVRSYLVVLGGSWTFADDHVNNVFIKAWAALDKLQPRRSSPGAWLHTLARNYVIDQGRSAYVRRVTITPQLPEPVPDWGADPTADAVLEDLAVPADDRVERIQAALAQLPEEQRQMILARHWDGKTHKDVAQEIGTSPDAARARLLRAMTRLRALLGLGGSG